MLWGLLLSLASAGMRLNAAMISVGELAKCGLWSSRDCCAAVSWKTLQSGESTFLSALFVTAARRPDDLRVRGRNEHDRRTAETPPTAAMGHLVQSPWRKNPQPCLRIAHPPRIQIPPIPRVIRSFTRSLMSSQIVQFCVSRLPSWVSSHSPHYLKSTED
jgi:hypothetical protein